MTTYEIVKGRIGKLEEEKERKKTIAEMFRDAVEQDEEYMRLKEQADEAGRRLRLHKEAILNEPEFQKAKADLKDINQELRELAEVLSGDLLGYTKETNRMIVEGETEAFIISIKATAKKTNQQAMF